MNLAIIIPALADGGAERAAQIIGDYYVDNGNSVYYFIFNTDVKQVYKVKGEVIILDYKWINITKYRDLVCAAHVLKIEKKKYKIDCALSFMEGCNMVNVLSRNKEKVIVSVRTALSPRKELKGIFYEKDLIQKLYNKADVIVPVSDYVKADLEDNYGINKKKVVRISNPAIKRESIDEVWNYGDNAIVFVGRLSYVKQIDRIIRAFSYVNMKNENTNLIIIGRGQQKEYLQKTVERLGIEKKVHFVGYKESVGFFLKRAKLFVMCSKAEGFPNVMVEAMSYGVPVVTTDSPGGCGEIVGKINSNNEVQFCTYGILTPYISGKPFFSSDLSTEEILFAEAMLNVINDKNLYNHYREQSFKRAEDYSFNEIMKQWDSIIKL